MAAVNNSRSFSMFIAELFFILFIYIFFLMDIGKLPGGTQKPGRPSADQNAGISVECKSLGYFLWDF